MDLTASPTGTSLEPRRSSAAGFWVACVALFLASASIWFAIAVPALVMDGTLFVDLLADARGSFPTYYHAGYLPLGVVAEWIVGSGRSVDALTLVSATCGAATLVLLAVALEAEVGRRAAWVAPLFFAAAPATWLLATNIEVHAAQAFGAAVVLAVAVRAQACRTSSAAGALALAVAFATTLHNSNLMLAGGAAWIAARSESGDWHFERRRAVWMCGGAALGALAGWLMNTLIQHGVQGAEPMTITHLVMKWGRATSLDFLWRELLVPWSPIFVLAAFCLPRSAAAWRAAAPFASAAAPSLLVFGLLAIPTLGGYFASSGVFAIAAALVAANNEPRRATLTKPWFVMLRKTALVVAVLVGALLGLGDARSEQRLEFTRVAADRLALAHIALPNGGCFISIDPTLQTVSGRDPRVYEIDVTTPMAEVRRGRVDLDVVVRLIETRFSAAAQRGDTVAFNMTWRLIATAVPELARYHEALLASLERYFVLEDTDVAGFPFKVGRPR